MARASRLAKDSSRPLVSVAIPAFNAERFIARTIESVVAQTYDNIEVMIVDDGSTDGTSAIVRRYVASDRRIRLLAQKNLGVAAARNLAIEHAMGDFIAPLDADDVWHRDKLERQVDAMLAAPSAIGLVYTWSRRVDRAGQPLSPCSGSTSDGAVFLPLLVGNFVGNASSPLIRTECFRKLGGYDSSFLDHDAQGCEDWELYLRVSECFRFMVIPECLVDYRLTDESMSANTGKMEKSHEILLDQVRDRHPDLPEFVYRWSKSSYFLYIANTASRSGRVGESLRYLWKAAGQDTFLLLNPRFQRLLVKNIARGVSGSQSRDRTRPARAGRRDVATPRYAAKEGLLSQSLIRRRQTRLLRLQETLNLPVIQRQLAATPTGKTIP